jgi:hypothetical protein
LHSKLGGEKTKMNRIFHLIEQVARLLNSSNAEYIFNFIERAVEKEIKTYKAFKASV